ncbi:hypothetical protein RI367_003869 [Sorochytrium milnesiophthora]
MLATPSSAENVAVAIRVRPLNSKEVEQGHQIAWRIVEGTTLMQVPISDAPASQSTPVSFTFDQIYTGSCSNRSIYAQLAQDIVRSAMEGINGTIFAYGQTASGKTFTMNGSAKDPGIVVLSIKDIYDHITAHAKSVRQSALAFRMAQPLTRNIQSKREWTVRMSYVEIYNEVIRDLLSEKDNDNLRVHEDTSGSIFIGSVTELTCTETGQTLKAILRAQANRSIGNTEMNERSSRSHTILTFTVESREVEDDKSGQKRYGATRTSRLNLVDLAGSERVGTTGAEGARLKEGGHINKSLLTLGTVIGKLSDSKENVHIPYRDSKLTRILQSSLGGNARTGIICTVTPSSRFVDETTSTLKFASRAKQIKNKPMVNETMSDKTRLKRMQEELDALKSELESTKQASQAPADTHLQAAIERLKQSLTGETAPKSTKRRQTWMSGQPDLQDGDDDEEVDGDGRAGGPAKRLRTGDSSKRNSLQVLPGNSFRSASTLDAQQQQQTIEIIQQTTTVEQTVTTVAGDLDEITQRMALLREERDVLALRVQELEAGKADSASSSTPTQDTAVQTTEEPQSSAAVDSDQPVTPQSETIALQTQIDQLQQSLTAANERIGALTQEAHNQVQAEEEALREQVSQLEASSRQLEQQLAVAATEAKHTAQQHAEQTEMKDQYIKTMEQLLSQQSDILDLLQNVSVPGILSASVPSELEPLRSALQVYTAQHDQVVVVYEKKLKHAAELQSFCSTETVCIQQYYENVVQDTTKQLRSAEAERDAALVRAEEATGQCEVMSVELQTSHQTAQQLDEQRVLLDEKLQAVEQARQEMEQDCKSLSVQLEILQAQATEQSKTVDALTTAADADKEKLAAVHRERAQLEEALAAAMAQSQTQAKDLADMMTLQATDAANQVRRLSEECAQLQVQLDTARQEQQEALAKMARLEADKMTAEQAVTALQQVNEALAADGETLQSQVTELEAVVAKLTQKLRVASEQHTADQALAEELRQSHSVKAEHQARADTVLHELKSELESCTADLQQLHATNVALQSSCEACSSQLSDLLAQVSDWKAKAAESEAAASASRATAATLQDKLTVAERENAELLESNDKQAEIIQDMDLKLQTMTSSRNTLLADLDKLGEELKRRQGENGVRHGEQAATLERLQLEIAHLQGQLATATSDLDKQKQQNDSHVRDIIENAQLEGETRNQRIEVLSRQTEELSVQLAQQHSDFVQLSGAHEALMAKHAAIQSQLESATDAHAKAQERLAEANKLVQEYERLMEDQGDELQTIADERNKLDSQCKQQAMQIDNLSSALRRRQEMDEASQHQDALRVQQELLGLQQAHAQALQRITELENSSARLVELETAKDESDRHLAECQQTITVLENRLNEMETEKASHESERLMLSETVSALQTRLSQLQAGVDDRQDQVNSLRVELQNMADERRRLESKCDSLQYTIEEQQTLAKQEDDARRADAERLERTTAELANHQAALEQLHAELEQYKVEAARQLHEAAHVLATTTDELRLDLERARTSMQQLQEALLNEQQQSAETQASLTAQLAQVQAQAREYHRSAEEASSEYDRLQARIQATEEERAETERTLLQVSRELQQAHHAAKATELQIAALTATAEDHRLARAKLLDRTSHLEQEVQALRLASADAEKRQGQMSRLERERTELEARLSEVSDELQGLATQIKEQQERGRFLEEQLAEREARLQSAVEHTRQLQTQLGSKDLQDQIKQLRTNVANLDTQNKEQKALISMKQSENRSLMTEITQVKQELERLRTMHDVSLQEQAAQQKTVLAPLVTKPAAPAKAPAARVDVQNRENIDPRPAQPQIKQHYRVSRLAPGSAPAAAKPGAATNQRTAVDEASPPNCQNQ